MTTGKDMEHGRIQKEINYMKIRFFGNFKYKTRSNCEGMCHLILAQDDLRYFALATELDHNPGPSVTNAVEELFNQVKERFETEQLEWYEQYTYHQNPKLRFTKWCGSNWKPTNEAERKILQDMIAIAGL